jgi:hypothetical protein
VAAFAGLLRQSAFQVTNIRFFALAVKVLSLLVSKKKKKKKKKNIPSNASTINMQHGSIKLHWSLISYC